MEGMLWKPILKTPGCSCESAAIALCTLCIYCSAAACIPLTQCCHNSTWYNSGHYHQHLPLLCCCMQKHNHCASFDIHELRCLNASCREYSKVRFSQISTCTSHQRMGGCKCNADTPHTCRHNERVTAQPRLTCSSAMLSNVFLCIMQMV